MMHGRERCRMCSAEEPGDQVGLPDRVVARLFANSGYQWRHFVLTRSVNGSISKSRNKSRPNKLSHRSCAL